MTRANRSGGCLGGFIVWLMITLPLIYAYDTIVKLFSDKKVDSSPSVQAVVEKEQKEKAEAARLEAEHINETARKEQRNKSNSPNVTVDERFIFSNMVVRDKRTGLTWTRDADLGWQTWKKSFELVKQLNQKKYGGYNDWRIPNKKELLSLISYAKSKGYADPHGGSKGPSALFNQMGFYGVQHGDINYMSGYYYWTSSKSKSLAPVCVVSMHNGYDYSVFASENHYVWPVRGGQ